MVPVYRQPSDHSQVATNQVWPGDEGQDWRAGIWQDRVRAGDGTRIYLRCHHLSRAEALIIFVHDHGEHSRCYDQVGQRFVSHGMAFASFDLRSHGVSEGFRGLIPRYDLLLGDLSSVVERCRLRYPSLPVILAGHGAGAALAATFAARAHLGGRQQAGLQGLMVSAPAVYCQWHPAWIGLSFLVGSLVPRMPLRRKGRQRGFRNPGLARTWRHDPLRLRGGIHARTGFELARGAYGVRSELGHIQLPTLWLQGSDDPVAGAAESEAMFDRLASHDKTFRSYHGFQYDLLQDYGWATIADDMADWVRMRLTPARSGY